MQLLEGRKAVVTGGSRGIGREICLLLAENGADVALAYRKSTVEAEQLREEIAAMGRSCIAVQADVSVSADVDRFVTQAAQALGGIDILVNCAGVFPQALIEDINTMYRPCDTGFGFAYWRYWCGSQFWRGRIRGVILCA